MKANAFNVVMQSGNPVSIYGYRLDFTMNDITASSNMVSMMTTMYQRFRIRAITFKFMPNKMPMSAQIINTATSVPLNPPRVEAYIQRMYEDQNYSVSTVLPEIMDKPGVRRVSAMRPFKVSFVPRIEQIRTLPSSAITTGIRSPVMPVSLSSGAINHFGACVYIRNPYDANIPPGVNLPVYSFNIVASAVVEFFQASGQ